MKLKSIYWAGVMALAMMAAACGDDAEERPGPIVDPVEPVVPLPALNRPTDPVVSVRAAKTAVVQWKGDTTATAYQVRIDGRVIELKGTSCGVTTTEDTDYTWGVRAVRQADTTEWVEGPTFRTLHYDDPRDKWVGYWTVDEWEAEAAFAGIELPLDDLMAALPQDLIDNLLATSQFMITTPEEQGEVSQYDELLITFDFLEQLELPEVAAIFLEDGQFWLEESLNIPLAYPLVPFPISDLPFLADIPGLGEMDMMIRRFEVVLDGLQMTAGPSDGNTMPFSAVLGGRVIIETEDDLINAGITIMKPTLKLTLDTTMRHVEVVPEEPSEE